MELMGIEADTPLKIEVKGRRLIVEPLSDEDRAKRFTSVMKRTGEKNAKLFKKLAE
jgi:bifunctional DNA-binding transcriptional regulator/antitoxin component of YhaV-PrlF toxin-antitoxin module